MTIRASSASRASEIREEPAPIDVSLLVHPGWRDRFPWLVQGITTRGANGDFDLALIGARGGGDPAWLRWRELRRAVGFPAAVHGRQVHGSRVALHREIPPGIFFSDGVDGHVTASPGLLLTVALADCVPVFLVAPRRRAVGLLHAGWRGVAAGILEAGVGRLRDQLGVDPEAVHVHLGPSICGECYEVGPEVHRALGLEDPREPRSVDLCGALLERARNAGVVDALVSRSALCTLCGPGDFFSHRGGDTGRQVALLGVRSGGDPVDGTGE